jgi:hypothetical protein
VTRVLGGGLDSTDVTSPRNKCGSRGAETIQIYVLKGKAAPIQAWTGPEGPRISRQSAHESGKVVSHLHCICVHTNLKRRRYKKKKQVAQLANLDAPRTVVCEGLLYWCARPSDCFAVVGRAE